MRWFRNEENQMWRSESSMIWKVVPVCENVFINEQSIQADKISFIDPKQITEVGIS